MQISALSFLVVEDHPFQRNALVGLLQQLSAKNVHTAVDGADALRMLTQAPHVDVIISDLEMPKMDGMEFIRHLGERDYRASVIIASALDRALLTAVETMTRSYGINLLGAISKPVTADALISMLKLHGVTPKSESRPSVAGAAHQYTREEIVAGLDNNEFEPFLQPQIEVATRRLVGVEALARWRHPERGIVTPAAFIQVLEDSGEIDRLMWVMLNKSIAFCNGLSDASSDTWVSINLSLKSLIDTNLANRILEIARARNIEPRRICLEVKESAATTDVGKALENLTRLRMKGFGLSIDDYGTGYSSMQQLTRIPFTELKIDRSFVANASVNAQSRVILASSLEMARKLGIEAVAEGVETQQDWDLLVELGCDLAQGYYVGKPMAQAAYLEWERNLESNAMTIVTRG